MFKLINHYYCDIYYCAVFCLFSISNCVCWLTVLHAYYYLDVSIMMLCLSFTQSNRRNACSVICLSVSIILLISYSCLWLTIYYAVYCIHHAYHTSSFRVILYIQHIQCALNNFCTLNITAVTTYYTIYLCYFFSVSIVSGAGHIATRVHRPAVALQ